MFEHEPHGAAQPQIVQPVQPPLRQGHAVLLLRTSREDSGKQPKHHGTPGLPSVSRSACLLEHWLPAGGKSSTTFGVCNN